MSDYVMTKKCPNRRTDIDNVKGKLPFNRKGGGRGTTGQSQNEWHCRTQCHWMMDSCD
jgi:hypothetical protein